MLELRRGRPEDRYATSRLGIACAVTILDAKLGSGEISLRALRNGNMQNLRCCAGPSAVSVCTSKLEALDHHDGRPHPLSRVYQRLAPYLTIWG